MTESQAQPAPAPARKRPGAVARLGCSVLLIVGLLGGLELAARLAGAGDPMEFGGSKLIYQQIYPPLFQPGSKPDTLRARDPRLVDRSFPAKGGRRVFVFGESAVKGLGMSENASFSRALERQLRNAGLPDSVVNCGIVALDSRQIVTCVKDVAKVLQPGDYVILHVGNNEFLETHAWRFLEATHKMPARAAIDDVLRRSRLYMALKNGGARQRGRKLTPEMFSIDALRGPAGGGGGTGAAEDPGSERKLVEAIEAAHLGVTPDEIKAAGETHKEHLRTAIETAKAAGAKVILMTVATNLEWEGVRDPEGGWLAKAKGAAAKVEDALAAHDKLVDDRSLSSNDHWHAVYERAVLKRALGDMAGARADFQRANDEDPHLRRCLALFNENLRDLAKETQVTLVDGATALAAASKDGIVGFDMLYDYVHFNPEGGERLGAELAKAIAGADKASAIDAFVAKRRDVLAARTQDALEVDEYYGWNADRPMLADRNLWKYDEHREHLEKKLARSAEENVWLGNYWALQIGGEEKARQFYAFAKGEKADLAPVIDANVKWLDAR